MQPLRSECHGCPACYSFVGGMNEKNIAFLEVRFAHGNVSCVHFFAIALPQAVRLCMCM